MTKRARMHAALLLVVLWSCARVPPAAEPAPGRTPEPVRPEERREAPVRIGVIVSSTGSPVLRQYGELVLDGARVAADAASTPRRSVELVVRDDGGTAAGAERALRELEQLGIRVVVGPLVDEALLAAARARTSEDLLIISPTSVSDHAGTRNVYALNVVDTRGSTALGEYARRWRTVGVLYGRTPEGDRQMRAFADAYRRGGGTLVDAGYPPGSSSVGTQLRRLREAGVEAIYFPASDRELQLILPQLDGTIERNVQLLGNETWLSDAARRMPQRVLEGAIIATPLLRESDQVAWNDFVRRYEAMHRRSLVNPVPALGYDATTLAVRALTTGSNAAGEYRGATGVLSLRSSTVTRRPFLVRIEAGRLVPVS